MALTITRKLKERKFNEPGIAETRHGAKDAVEDLGNGEMLNYLGLEAGIRKHCVAVIVRTTLALQPMYRNYSW